MQAAKTTGLVDNPHSDSMPRQTPIEVRCFKVLHTRIKSTVILSTFSTLFSNSEVIVAGIVQFLVLGRGDLDLVGCTFNEG